MRKIKKKTVISACEKQKNYLQTVAPREPSFDLEEIFDSVQHFTALCVYIQNF